MLSKPIFVELGLNSWGRFSSLSSLSFSRLHHSSSYATWRSFSCFKRFHNATGTLFWVIATNAVVIRKPFSEKFDVHNPNIMESCSLKLNQTKLIKSYHGTVKQEGIRPGASSIYLCERGKKVWPFQVYHLCLVYKNRHCWQPCSCTFGLGAIFKSAKKWVYLCGGRH